MTYIQNKKIQNYVHHVDTNFTKEIISTSLEYYPGTEVIYTPPADASKVIYECNLQVAWSPDASTTYLSTRLQYSDNNGSSWNDIDGTRLFEGSNSAQSGADYDWYNYFWIFSLDSWSGERKLRLAGRAQSVSREGTIGRSYNANATEGVGSCPHVSIYSIL